MFEISKVSVKFAAFLFRFALFVYMLLSSAAGTKTKPSAAKETVCLFANSTKIARLQDSKAPKISAEMKLGAKEEPTNNPAAEGSDDDEEEDMVRISLLEAGNKGTPLIWLHVCFH